MLVVCIFASALGALIMCLLVLRDGFSPISSDPTRADHDVLITRLGDAVAGTCFATTAILATVLVARTPAAPPVRQMTERLTALDRERQALGEQVGALGASVQGLREQMGAVDGGVQSMRLRLDQTEGRVANAEAGLAKAETGLTRAEAGLGRTQAGLKRLSEELVQATARPRQQVDRPVATRPAASPARENVAPRPPQRRVDVERPHETTSAVGSEAASPRAVTHAPPPAHVATTPHKPAPKPSAAVSAPQDLPETNLTDKVRKDWDVIRRGFSKAGDEISDAMRRFGRSVTGRD